jgi:hypothetical protein
MGIWGFCIDYATFVPGTIGSPNEPNGGGAERTE